MLTRIDTRTLKLWEQNIKEGFFADISKNYYISVKNIRKAINNGEASEYIINSINQYIKDNGNKS
jgi:hypothetical protein